MAEDIAPRPAPRRRRPDWAPLFIEALGKTGVVLYAAQAAGIVRATAYKRRQRDEAFATAWLHAEQDGYDRLHAEARRRAFSGDSRVLMFLLKMHAPKAEREVSAADLRRAVERIAAQDGLDPDELLAEAERFAREMRPELWR